LHQSLNTPLEQLKISDAIKLCAKAWKEVTSETIRNCWLKTGILPALDDTMEIETSVVNDQLIQEEYCELQDLINGLSNIEASDRLSAEDFIRIDNETQEVEITDEEIISYVRPTAESESEDESSIVKQKITTEEVLGSLETVLFYIQDPPENLTFKFKHINSIKAIKGHISKHAAYKKKQSTLDSWINK
jgi:hypothetical protein